MCHYWAAWSAWWKRNYLCCHQQLWGSPQSRYCWAVQQRTSSNIPGWSTGCVAWAERSRVGRASHIIWDNVSFHRGPRIRNWFHNEQHFMNVFFPPYSPFLNPTEEFFSAWRWKVYDRNPYTGKSTSSNEWSIWWDRTGILPGLDLAS